jgi:hypothetical protein
MLVSSVLVFTFAALSTETASAFQSPSEFGVSVSQAMKDASARRNISVEPFDGVLPQLVDGAGWQTTIVLTNLDTALRHYVLYFVGDNGSPVGIPLTGSSGPVARVTGELQPNQTVILESTGTSTSLVQGYALLFALDRTATDPASKAIPTTIGGYGIFRQRAGGRPDFEATVPFVSMFGQRWTIPFDNRSSFSTGISMVNADPSVSSAVTLTARDLSGNILRTDTINLNSGSKTVFATPTRYPDLAGRVGILQITSRDSVSVLGLRFNPSGAFTSVHPLSLPE